MLSLKTFSVKRNATVDYKAVLHSNDMRKQLLLKLQKMLKNVGLVLPHKLQHVNAWINRCTEKCHENCGLRYSCCECAVAVPLQYPSPKRITKFVRCPELKQPSRFRSTE
jgi:hypothetical protein